jgi:hypothetical protein
MDHELTQFKPVQLGTPVPNIILQHKGLMARHGTCRDRSYAAAVAALPSLGARRRPAPQEKRARGVPLHQFERPVRVRNGEVSGTACCRRPGLSGAAASLKPAKDYCVCWAALPILLFEARSPAAEASASHM